MVSKDPHIVRSVRNTLDVKAHTTEVKSLPYCLFQRFEYPEKNTNCDYRQSDGIYATTVQELTHASHRELDVGMFSIFGFNDCSKTLLMESWTEGVEPIVTSDRYWALDSRYVASN